MQNVTDTETSVFFNSNQNNQIDLIRHTSNMNEPSSPDLMFQKRIDELYPVKRVTFVSFLFLIVNLFVIIMEHSYSLPTSGVKLHTKSMITDSIVYFSSNQYVAATSLINCIYGVLALVSSKFKKMIFFG